MSESDIQAKTDRQCNAALATLTSLAEDLGTQEALNLYKAQTAAFVAFMSKLSGSKTIGLIITAATVDSIIEGLSK